MRIIDGRCALIEQRISWYKDFKHFIELDRSQILSAGIQLIKNPQQLLGNNDPIR